MITLTTYPPVHPHQVLDVVTAVGASLRSFTKEPDLGVAMQHCRDGLRQRASELGADQIVGCQFQVDFGPKAVHVTGFGTAIRTL